MHSKFAILALYGVALASGAVIPRCAKNGVIPADPPAATETPAPPPKESEEEPAEKPKEEPAEKPKEEPAEKPKEEPAEKPKEEPAEKPKEEKPKEEKPKAPAGDAIPLTADIVLAINPELKDCAAQANKCSKPEDIASLTQKAFDTYGITTKAEQAAILALTVFESVGWKYRARAERDKGPGQGTSNMQMYNFNREYAETFPEVAKDMAKFPATDDATDEQKHALVDVLMEDAYNFGSGAWFYSTKCSDATKKKVQTGSDEGFNEYMMECVNIGSDTMPPERTEGFAAMKKHFGL